MERRLVGFATAFLVVALAIASLVVALQYCCREDIEEDKGDPFCPDNCTVLTAWTDWTTCRFNGTGNVVRERTRHYFMFLLRIGESLL